MSNNKKIQQVVTPVAEAMWAKITEPQTSQFNSTPMYSMDMVFTPDEAADFSASLQGQLDDFYDETLAGLNAAKKKGLSKADIFKEQVDKEGNLTGNLLIKTKQYGQNMNGVDMPMPIADATGTVLRGFKKLVGNGSKVRAKLFPKPYYMASTNTCGISLRLNAVQIIDLIEYGSSGGFDSVEGGFTATEEVVDESPFAVEAEDF